MQDGSQIYEIQTKILSTKQGNLSMVYYYNIMNRLWLELDQYENLQLKCSDDIQIVQEYVERGRVYIFLAGLNETLDQACAQVLGKKRVPSLMEAFSIIRSERE